LNFLRDYKLACLEIYSGDILDFCNSTHQINKIYLSNAISEQPSELRPKLARVSDCLPIGGLIYASNGNDICEAMENTGLEVCSIGLEDFPWNPLVLVKRTQSRIA
jgi:hypothetical protein